MPHFIITDRKTDYLLPPSLDDWLNQDHLARFIVDHKGNHPPAEPGAFNM